MNYKVGEGSEGGIKSFGEVRRLLKGGGTVQAVALLQINVYCIAPVAHGVRLQSDVSSWLSLTPG